MRINIIMGIVARLIIKRVFNISRNMRDQTAVTSLICGFAATTAVSQSKSITASQSAAAYPAAATTPIPCRK